MGLGNSDPSGHGRAGESARPKTLVFQRASRNSRKNRNLPAPTECIIPRRPGARLPAFTRIRTGGRAHRTWRYAVQAVEDARATHQGSFVWSGGAQTNSTATEEFVARAHGGFRFYTAAGTSTGARLAPGSGVWTQLSDRNAKENIDPVDVAVVLSRVVDLPIGTWNYKTQDRSIRHIGPMAQDFYAAFAVAEDDKGITTIDADGVALAAIQGLHSLVQEQQAVIDHQQSTIDELGARLARLERMLGSNE